MGLGEEGEVLVMLLVMEGVGVELGDLDVGFSRTSHLILALDVGGVSRGT